MSFIPNVFAPKSKFITLGCAASSQKSINVYKINLTMIKKDGENVRKTMNKLHKQLIFWNANVLLGSKGFIGKINF